MRAERPILFSAPMVRAILEGRKTQTRRVVKLRDGSLASDDDIPVGENNYVMDFSKTFPSWKRLDCPYGKPGDSLWVRETWRVGAWNMDGGIAVDYLASNHIRKEWLYGANEEQFEKYVLQSTEDCIKAGLTVDADGYYKWADGYSPCRKRPSIYMPRWASRINLEIIEVRVERVQDISEEDARAEGITDGGCLNCGNNEPCGCKSPNPNAQDSFAWLWDSINGDKHGCSWLENPFVWVVSFKNIKVTI